MSSTEFYTFSSTVYLDQLNKCYKRIIVINKRPPTNSILYPLSTRIHLPKVSPFKQNTCCEQVSRCVFAVLNPEEGGSNCLSGSKNFLTNSSDDISTLFGLLIGNGYTINTELTNMMRSQSGNNKSSGVNAMPEIICFATK